MDRWDVLLYAAAAYIAVMSLVRLMANRRDELVDEVREQVEQIRKTKKPKKSSEETSNTS